VSFSPTPLQVERIQKDLNVKDTTIVFTLRAIAKILPSRYQQSLKKGNTWGYHEWLRNVLQLDGSGESPQIKFGNYSNLVERWANVFGAQNVVVVIVDESTPNLIFDAFHEILNLKPDSIVKVKDSALNRSLTTEETVLLAALNESFKNEGSWKEYSTFVRNHIVKSWSGREASQDHTKIHTPEWAIDKAVEIAERNVAHLKELNVKVLGDLEHLASRNVLIGDTSESSVIPARLASETLLNLQRRFAKRLQRRDDRIKRLLAQKRPLYKVILRRFKK
jgi:hypothetical protein